VFFFSTEHFRHSLLYYSDLKKKKTVVEAHRFISETYFESAPVKTCEFLWFRQFKNNDFDSKKHSGQPKSAGIGKFSARFKN